MGILGSLVADEGRGGGGGDKFVDRGRKTEVAIIRVSEVTPNQAEKRVGNHQTWITYQCRNIRTREHRHTHWRLQEACNRGGAAVGVGGKEIRRSEGASILTQ